MNLVKPKTIDLSTDNLEDELFIGSTFSGDLYNSDVIRETTTERFEERYGFNTYKK